MNLPESTTSTPVGSVVAYTGTIIPRPTTLNKHATNLEEWGWIACDGRKLEIEKFPELYVTIGEKYSPPGTPSGYFCLPDFQGLFPNGNSTNPQTKAAAVIYIVKFAMTLS